MKQPKVRAGVLVAVIVVLFAILYLYGNNSNGLEGFAGAGAAGNELVIVKAEWCGHCKRAMPEFERLAAASPIRLQNGSSVTVRLLDEKKDKAVVDTMGVKGFPTILYMKDGQRMEYSGERTFDGVMGFLESSN